MYRPESRKLILAALHLSTALPSLAPPSVFFQPVPSVGLPASGSRQEICGLEGLEKSSKLSTNGDGTLAVNTPRNSQQTLHQQLSYGVLPMNLSGYQQTLPHLELPPNVLMLCLLAG